MEDPTAIAMNLTFLGTLGVGLVMFLGVFLSFVTILLLAGLGRLLATGITALFRGRQSAPGSAQRAAAKAARPARKEPRLSPEWAAAVERADARASARAKAEAAPEVTVSVRELPSPKAPVRDITEVGPLVESATDRNGALTAAPHAAPQRPVPARSPVLDTGSLTTLQHRPPQPDRRQDQQRKAS